MDQVEVDVVAPELFEALLECARRVAAPVIAVAKLGRDEQLAAVELARQHGVANAGLVAVRGRSVDRAIAGPDRVYNGPGRLGLGHLKHAEAQLGHAIAVVQVQLWEQCRLGCHT